MQRSPSLLPALPENPYAVVPRTIPQRDVSLFCSIVSDSLCLSNWYCSHRFVQNASSSADRSSAPVCTVWSIWITPYVPIGLLSRRSPRRVCDPVILFLSRTSIPMAEQSIIPRGGISMDHSHEVSLNRSITCSVSFLSPEQHQHRSQG